MIFLKSEKILNTVICALFVCSIAFLFFLEGDVRVQTALKNIDYATVVIDPGHGGEDGGAVGDGILEKEINLDVSQKLEHILNLCGVNTDMTRRTDDSLSIGSEGTVRKRKVSDIKKRVEKINETPDAILISVHQNSFPQEKYKGAQVFFSERNSDSEELAKIVQNSFKEGIDNNNNRQAKKSDKTIYILNNVNCPSILIECGFLSNNEEARLLKTDTYKTKLATCIAAGFLRYKDTEEK